MTDLDAAPPTPDAIRAALPSWRPGPTLDRLVDGLVDLTTGPDAVAPEQRVAAFDNDGTLACEKPYTSADGFLAQAEDSQPRALGAKALERLATQYDGIPVEAYAQRAAAYLASARHPDLDRSWREVVYAPMIELIDVLHALGFTVVMSTGSSRDFMRLMAREPYHLLPEQVIGSEVKVEWRDGQVLRTRDPEPLDRGAGKPDHVWSRMGRLPVVAAGNTHEDTDLLECARLSLLIDHDDADREYAYRDKKALAAAEEHGWLVVSMKDDFAEVFPPR